MTDFIPDYLIPLDITQSIKDGRYYFNENFSGNRNTFGRRIFLKLGKYIINNAVLCYTENEGEIIIYADVNRSWNLVIKKYVYEKGTNAKRLLKLIRKELQEKDKPHPEEFTWSFNPYDLLEE